ncbi:Acetyltransferase (isoleucine patch superfamily) [Halopseudomonas xinjiangensis]|uniref:Acetyltransferase (Isoleucine patch superfamily) n=1 Tax=Halopseudomonas xinjiangensis TaxID=487184 RepID=A0A1H1M0P8_9GAMM|nr:Acetyltransferase (isoleucine patch superfamily) [Halopseudomonas xinjiangensis]
MNRLVNHYWKRWLRRNRLKLAQGPRALPRDGRLILEPRVEIGDVIIETRDLTIGHSSYIRSGGQLIAVESIGRYCSIGNRVMIGVGRDTHPVRWVTTHPFANDAGQAHHAQNEPVVIDHDVWIGQDVIIMSGVRIGTGAVIAAGAVVTKHVAPYTIVGGNPARMIKVRFDTDITERLLASRWWETDHADLVRMQLDDPAIFLSAIESSPATPAVAAYEQTLITRSGCKKAD